jgi:uncharacterized protein (UPF0276 family)
MPSNTHHHNTLASRAGLGFRRELIPALQQAVPEHIGFFEVAPENWAGMGGRAGRDFRAFTERYPFVCHGLSVNRRMPCSPNTCPGALTTATCTTCCRFP